MKHMIKNVIPYWKSVVIILFLLVVQAYCDLSLPSCTSNLIDVGIQNSGVSHIVPEQITADEFDAAQMFMMEEEKALWNSMYEKQDEKYVLTEDDERELEKADDTLLIAIVMNYQLGQSDEFQTMMQTAAKEGGMDDKMILQIRNSMQGTVDSIGSETLKSIGIQYAVACDKAAGVDTDAIQISYLWRTGGKMAALAVLMMAAATAISFFASRVGAGVGRDLRGRLFGQVMGYSSAEIDRFSSASLITRATNDVQQVQMVTGMMLRMVLYAPILGIGGIIRVVQTGAGMGWIIALAVVVLTGFVLVLVAIAMSKFKIMQKMVDGLNLVSREILTGIPVIRAFGREKREEERFDAANQDLKKTQLFTNRVMTFMMPGMMMLMNGIVVLIVWVSAKHIDAGTLQVGTMTAFITYTMQVVMAFLMLTAMSIMLPRAGVAANRINEVLTTETVVKDVPQPRNPERHDGVLRFDHVSFRYPGAEKDVLHDISFTAEPGKVTAIIGSTGSGKSTLVNLIPRFYDVTEGSITLDGMDVRNIAMKDLRQEIGFVPQKGILFSGTIASNLKFGCPDAGEDEIKLAAEIAQAADFIEEKNKKYDSYIAQGGRNVSGGQKQRLAIARAIAKNPKIYVFDDSFSALDMKTDAALRKALEGKVAGCTEIIVAQRVSTILQADQILVLDEGNIVGRGTHEELLSSCEVYRQIAVSQLSEKELGMVETADMAEAIRSQEVTGHE